MTEMQRTLSGTVTFGGVGLHTGEKVKMEIVPAPENFGYKFQRVDLDGEPVIPADCDLVVGTERGTTLEKDGARVYTTEHILAALYGCQVDNALIKINGPEIPIMDGSSGQYVEAFEKVGYVDQNAEREYLDLDENIPWEDVEKGIEFLAVPDVNYRLTVMVDYKSPVLGTQHATIYNINQSKEETLIMLSFWLKERRFLKRN
jgi:UDP-3-O-[3-hydroxymyristoyl] N-acetylglucosamine deacetylase/3-hydroxyacyl-[acyl-carrier-protein] dehydratase